MALGRELLSVRGQTLVVRVGEGVGGADCLGEESVSGTLGVSLNVFGMRGVVVGRSVSRSFSGDRSWLPALRVMRVVSRHGPAPSVVGGGSFVTADGTPFERVRRGERSPGLRLGRPSPGLGFGLVVVAVLHDVEVA
jgi:hypothetical protein